MKTLRSRTDGRLNRPGLMALVLFAAWTGCASEAWAAVGEVHGLSGSGLDLTVDTRWVYGLGYQPVRVTVSRGQGQAINTDRSLTFEFVVGQAWLGLDLRTGENHSGRVVQQIELPAGTQSVETTVSVPPLTPLGAYSFSLLEDDAVLPRLSLPGANHVAGLDSNVISEDSTVPHMLVLGGKPADTTQLFGALYGYSQLVRAIAPMAPGAATSSQPTLQLSRSLPSAIALPAADFPTRWIDYSGLDVVCLSLDELSQLSKQRPESYRAILAWTTAGGNLWVYGAGGDWQGLPELEKQLGIPAVAAKDPAKRGWTEPSKKLHGELLWDQTNNATPYYTAPQPATPVPAAQPPDPPDRPPFLFRQHGMGMVVALAAKNPFPGDSYQWAWLLKATDADRWLWRARHGMSTCEGNRDFWNFLIPGVGLAPVVAFQVLISVFVIVIGPVNYWLLRRRRRLHLLVVTIPLAAVAITVGLFGYGMIADGFQTRVRARSVTRIDQHRGEAVCWSRLSYYSGLAPADGLTFPDDLAVLPIPRETDHDSRQNPRELIWQGNGQWLASGWLSSRVPTQYMTIRSRPSRLRLEIAESGEKSGRIDVTNRLDTRIEQLLLRTGNGKYYATTGMSADATARLQPVDPTAAFGELRAIYQRSRPDFPPGLFRTNRNNLLRSRRYLYRSPQGQVASVSQQSGLLEKSLNELATVSDLEPGSYVAIVERSPEVHFGTPAAREQASFHAIIGKL